ncbi:MAG: aminoacetone oxidase family FAD-binding enzyme [Thermoanaerobaculia bacterium]
MWMHYQLMPDGVLIVGGGAAGLVAAVRCADALAGGTGPVSILEATRDAGRKILVSGGARCNILPMADAPERFVSESPNRLVRRFLDRWPLAEQRAFFEELLGAPLHEEPETKKLFPPTQRSRDVRDALRARALNAGVTIRYGAVLRDLARRDEGGFVLTLADGEELPARAVLLATGGRSVLAGGADARGLEVAAALGHSIRTPYPALAPLSAEGAPHAALSGLSLRAELESRRPGESAVSEGGFLFTHRGYSGPSVLDVAHVVERARIAGDGAQVFARFGVASGYPPVDWDEELRSGSGSVLGMLRRRLPERLAELLLASAGLADQPISRLTRESRRAIVEMLTRFPLPVTGTEGYRTAEVMGGGVALEEVDPGSGASRLVPGLFLAGEILDAFGPIGGFNFQWAWATGWSAGNGLARSDAG